jgi:branched-chain amino acid transport system ATP-binding protein
MTDPILSVQKLSASYGAITALHDVSLEIYPGELVALLGVNGAGKSTTLKSIAGVLRPVKGNINLFGQPITTLSPEKLVEKGISLVPEGREIFTSLTVEENLRIGAFTRYSNKTFQQDLETVFGLFPILKSRFHQPGGQLSGGEQQQLAIARALMSRPQLLMLDEPSLGLAPVLVEQIFSLIQQLHARGTTILLVEQNVEISLNIVDRVYLLKTGRVEFNGTAKELRNRTDVVSAVYFGGKNQKENEVSQ